MPVFQTPFVMCQALEVRNETDLKERLVSTPDGFIRNGPGGSDYAYAPGFQDQCKEKILEALDKLYEDWLY